MKKSLMITSLLCLLSVFAHAQYNTLTINNNSSCTVYVIIHGTLSTNGCDGDYRSSVIAVAPGSVTYNDPSMVPGGMNQLGVPSLGSSDNFTMARVYAADPAGTCPLSVVNMSDCLPGSVPSTTGFAIEDGVCSSCATVNIDFVGAGTLATIEIL